MKKDNELVLSYWAMAVLCSFIVLLLPHLVSETKIVVTGCFLLFAMMFSALNLFTRVPQKEENQK